MIKATPNKELVLEVSSKLQSTFAETLEKNAARKVAVNIDKILNLCHSPISFGPRTTSYLSSGGCVLIIAVSVISLINLRHFQIMPVKISCNQNLNFVVKGINFILISTVISLGARGTNITLQKLLGNLPLGFCTYQIDSALLNTRKLCYEFIVKYSFHSEMVVYHLKKYGKLFGSLYDYQFNPSFVERFIVDHESTYLKPLDPVFSNDSIDVVPDYQNLKRGIICFPFNKKIKNVTGLLICVLPTPPIVKNCFVLALFLEKVLAIKNQRS